MFKNYQNYMYGIHFNQNLYYFIFPVVSAGQHESWHQSLRQDLPTGNQACQQQGSIESSDDDWSDLSFYDLPDTLKVSDT